MHSQTSRSRGLHHALFIAALLGLTAAPAQALDSLWDAGRFSPAELPQAFLPAPFASGSASGGALLARELSRQDDFAFAGLGERLLRIPLRPVILGNAPRTPVDPERSLGLVLKLPFSL